MLPPFKIKSVEAIYNNTKEYRLKRIKEVGYNPFLLPAQDVVIDLLTDSGTSAMSDRQWAGIMVGDESYAGSVNFQHMRDAVKNIMGFSYILPAHQGRGAEKILDRALVKKGQIIPGNMHFDTTKAHIEDAGGRAIDCTINDIYNPYSTNPFKGNIDLKKLEAAIKPNPKNVAYILITITCNSGGGQPVSLENIKAAARIARKYKRLLFIDAARFAENAYFIKQREPGYANKTIRQIVRETFAETDGCTMSAKKDALVNMGGFIGLKDKRLYQQMVPLGVLLEGFPTYGGMNGRDMEALAIGLNEVLDENYLRYRIEQVAYLGSGFKKAGLPVLVPFGGHAIYLDALKFFPHIKREHFPGHTLSIELYIEGGIRVVEIGSVLAGRDPDTKENIFPKLELVRMAIPRRVYMQEHMDYVIECALKIWQRRKKIKGVKFVFESPIMRHFQSTFARL
ncbi:MAG: tryptophanase [Planctomycetota bacterium]